MGKLNSPGPDPRFPQANRSRAIGVSAVATRAGFDGGTSAGALSGKAGSNMLPPHATSTLRMV
jgi:hypothetical protein